MRTELPRSALPPSPFFHSILREITSPRRSAVMAMMWTAADAAPGLYFIQQQGWRKPDWPTGMMISRLNMSVRIESSGVSSSVLARFCTPLSPSLHSEPGWRTALYFRIVTWLEPLSRGHDLFITSTAVSFCAARWGQFYHSLRWHCYHHGTF